MKNLQTLFIILTAAMFFTACQKEETSSLWTVSGEVVQQDAQTPAITTPLEGINVYLLSVPFSIDTLTSWFTKTDIIDSTRTDVNGKYSFNALSPGDYVIMPADTVGGYQFDWSDSPDSVWISSTNTKSVYSINFSAPEHVIENDLFEYFEFVFNNNYNIGSKSKSILMYRTCRVTLGCGFWGIDPCDWYWDRISHGQALLNSKIDSDNNPDIYNYSENKCKDDFYKPLKSVQTKNNQNDYDTVELHDNRNASGFLYQYTDEFHLKFYIDGEWVYTLNVPGDYNLKYYNEFNVVWQNGGVEITPVN